MVALSDVFTEKQQFEWLLDTFLELYKIHPSEDELVTQYLVVGICKASAVVGMVRIGAQFHEICLSLERSWASNHFC